MSKERKRQFAYDALILLSVLALLTFITRLWPILLLIILGIFVAALVLLFQSMNKVEPVVPTPAHQEQPRPDTEQDVIARAFGLLQRRITEWIVGQFPDARWVWAEPNARERFAQGEPLSVLLNRAGGYRKADVRVKNLQFIGLVYESTQPDVPEDAPDVPAADDEDDDDVPAPVNYELLAFEWVEANMMILSSLSNDAIAENNETMLIQADILPHPDSWPAVCKELVRNGFTEAETEEGGIRVALPQ